jgi:hypothetical protein
MRQRTFELAATVTAVMLAACSQGQGTPTVAPEAPSYATTTGELLCDEYVALAKGCIDKGRMPGLVQRRGELTVLERMLREAAKGEPVSIDRQDVWGSALRAARAHKRLEASLLASDSPPEEPVVDRAPMPELCKSGIDQLPTECQ